MTKMQNRKVSSQRPIARLVHAAICGLSVAALAALPLLPSTAHAESFSQMFKQNVIDGSQINGGFGLNDEHRWNNGNGNQAGFRTDYGAHFNLLTGSLYGFSGGFSYYGQHQLIHYNRGLGFGKNLDKIADLFIQYQGFGAQVRAGRMQLSTPFANSDMFTMIPRGFMGQSVSFSLFNTPFFTDHPSTKASSYQPLLQTVYAPTFNYGAPVGSRRLQVYLARITEFSSRFGDHLVRGTDNYGTSGFGHLGYDGFQTGGIQYNESFAGGNVMAQGWFYNFKGAAKLAFYEGGYQMPAMGASGFRPYVRAEFYHETGSGADLDQLGSGTVHRIDSKFYGARLGVQATWHNLDASLIYAYQPSQTGSFRNGGMYHPYNDLSGSLYDDMMNAGITDFGPGRSAGIRITGNFTRNLSGLIGIMYYKATYGTGGDYYAFTGFQGFAQNGPVPGETTFIHNEMGHEVDATLSYNLEGLSPKLKGFSLTDALGVTHWNDAKMFQADRRSSFIDNRIYLNYAF